MSGVKAEIRRFLTSKLGAALVGVGDGAALVSNDLIDSTMVVELAAFLEATFGIEVRDEDLTLENLDSIEALAALVSRKRADAAPALAIAQGVTRASAPM